jgi:hypothetical protein
MKYTFFILLVIIFSINASGQNKVRHRFIPFFFTYSPRVLATHLTTGLNDDSAKVEAIHYWITRHIRYDVKKFMRYDFSHHSVKKILCRRKAICAGYADLFDELCKYGGIKSVSIPGYVKSSDVDIVDTFYLDEHIWNAALVEGQWRPIDATWDAGYVVGYKKLHLYPIIKIKYKPHFVRDPTDGYFMIASELFALDHLPANPHWQMMDTVLSIEGFARDSSVYYKRHYIYSLYSPQGRDTAYGLHYFAMDSDARDIEDGDKSHAYNPRNYLLLADAWRIRTEQVIARMKKKTVDSAYEVMLCDNALLKVKKSILYYDSTLAMILQERVQRAAFNDQKREIYNEYSIPMRSATHRNLVKLKYGMVASKNAHKSYLNALKVNDKRLENMHKDFSFMKARCPKKTLPEDSISAKNAIKVRQDTLWAMQAQLTKDSTDLESLYRQALHKANQYSEGVRKSQSMVETSIFTRIGFYDDFDYEVKRIIPHLTGHKLRTDSNFRIGQRLFLDTLYNSMRHYKSDLRDLYSNYRLMAFQIKRLKRACEDGNNFSYMNDANRKDMFDHIFRSDQVFQQWMGRAQTMRRYCRHQQRGTHREMRLLRFDQYIESMNSRIRQRQIGRKAAAHIRFTNGQRAQAVRLQRKIEKHKMKFTGT